MAIPSLVNFLTLLNTEITNTSALTSIVSTRHYHSILPQNGSLPALTFKVISINPTDTKDGASDYDQVRVQFSCYSSTGAGAETLYAALRTKFDRFTSSSGSVEFHFTRFIDRQPIDRDIDTGSFVVTVDYSFTIK